MAWLLMDRKNSENISNFVSTTYQNYLHFEKSAKSVFGTLIICELRKFHFIMKCIWPTYFNNKLALYKET